MRTPLISLVTVVLNNKLGLERTWRSISSQVFRDFEWIVVDGGSVDGTLEFIQALDPSLCRLRTGKDEGLYDAMNIGTAMATGHYVCYLNSGDCLYDSDSLSLVASSPREPLDIIFCGAIYSFGGNLERFRGPRQYASGIRHGNPCVHQSAFFPRTMLGNSPYSLKYKVCGDYYLFAVLFVRGAKATLLNAPVVRFEAGGLSHMHRARLFIEAAVIQRDILNLSFISIFMSKLRRWLSYYAYTFFIWRSRNFK